MNMKKNKLFTMALGASVLLSACQNNQSANMDVTLETEIDKVSYGIGVDIANNLSQSNLDEVDVQVMAAGINDVLQGAELKLSETEAREIINNYLTNKQNELKAAAASEGAAFLAENKTKEGVITTESGLQYEVLVEGNGPKPSINDQVVTHYHGTLINGEVFDSSVDRGEPVTFPVNGVIQGWTEALQLMSVGSKYKLYIPPYLAYGERGSGPKIGPNTTLVFEVELLEIKDKE